MEMEGEGTGATMMNPSSTINTKVIAVRATEEIVLAQEKTTIMRMVGGAVRNRWAGTAMEDEA